MNEIPRFAGGMVVSAVLIAACGSTAPRAPAAPASAITVSIEVEIGAPRPHDRGYSLGCRPTAGTLPFAGRVCALIAAHPAAMLRPHSSLTLCYDPNRGPFVSVRASWNGRTTRFSGQPGCGWPGLSPLTVYYNASIGRARLVG